MFCTLQYLLYQRGQENNAAESLASICNNSGNNEPCDVFAAGNVGGDHAINNDNRDMAVVNNVGDTKIIHNSCGTGPDVNNENWSGMVDIVGDNDNGSPSPSDDNGFKVRQINYIEPREVSAVGNIGGDHAINNNNHDVAVVTNVGDTEIIHGSCGTGPDINVENWLGVVDAVGDNDNGSPSPGGDNCFEFGLINNIELRDVAAVGNVGGGHVINNNNQTMLVILNL